MRISETRHKRCEAGTERRGTEDGTAGADFVLQHCAVRCIQEAEDWKQGEPNGLETGAGGWNFKSFRRTAAFDVERHTAAVAACGRCAQNGAEAGQMGDAAERRDGGWE